MGDKRQLDPTILREYDIRGIVGDGFNADEFRVIGRGFGSVVIENAGSEKIPTVAVGFDGRLSSPELANALSDGLTAGSIRQADTGAH